MVQGSNYDFSPEQIKYIKESAKEDTPFGSIYKGVIANIGLSGAEIDFDQALKHYLHAARGGYCNDFVREHAGTILKNKQPSDFDNRMCANIAYYYYQIDDREKMQQWYKPYDHANCTIALDAVNMATTDKISADLTTKGITPLLPGGEIKGDVKKQDLIDFINWIIYSVRITDSARFADEKYEKQLSVEIAKYLQPYFKVKKPMLGSEYLTFNGDKKLVERNVNKVKNEKFFLGLQEILFESMRLSSKNKDTIDVDIDMSLIKWGDDLVEGIIDTAHRGFCYPGQAGMYGLNPAKFSDADRKLLKNKLENLGIDFIIDKKSENAEIKKVRVIISCAYLLKCSCTVKNGKILFNKSLFNKNSKFIKELKERFTEALNVKKPMKGLEQGFEWSPEDFKDSNTRDEVAKIASGSVEIGDNTPAEIVTAAKDLSSEIASSMQENVKNASTSDFWQNADDSKKPLFENVMVMQIYIKKDFRLYSYCATVHQGLLSSIFAAYSIGSGKVAINAKNTCSRAMQVIGASVPAGGPGFSALAVLLENASAAAIQAQMKNIRNNMSCVAMNDWDGLFSYVASSLAVLGQDDIYKKGLEISKASKIKSKVMAKCEYSELEHFALGHCLLILKDISKKVKNAFSTSTALTDYMIQAVFKNADLRAVLASEKYVTAEEARKQMSNDIEQLKKRVDDHDVRLTNVESKLSELDQMMAKCLQQNGTAAPEGGMAL